MCTTKDNMTIYQVGDRVTIVGKAPACQDHPTGYKNVTLFWNPKMSEYCGKTVTIFKAIGDGKYRIKEDGGRWAWCNAFFEHVNAFDVCDDDEDIGEGVLDEYFKKFKVM